MDGLASCDADTFTRISSRQTDASPVNSCTWITFSSLEICFSIWSRMIPSPVTATVIRETAGFSVSPTVRLSMLYPRRLNRPTTRDNAPGVLSINIDSTIFRMAFTPYFSENNCTNFDQTCQPPRTISSFPFLHIQSFCKPFYFSQDLARGTAVPQSSGWNTRRRSEG